MFWVSDQDNCGAWAFTFTGERTGRRLIFPSCLEACSRPMIAPDGSVPPPAFTVPAELEAAQWAPDSRSMCGILAGYARPIRVGWFEVRHPRDLHVATFTGLFGHVHASQYNLLSCNLAADRAVLTATYNSIVATAVVSLARQKVLFEQDYPGTPNVVTAVMVAPNGLNLAVQHARQSPRPSQPPAPSTCHWSTQRPGPPLELCMVAPPSAAPPPVPTSAGLYSLTGTPHSIGRISGRGVAGWSGDGSRLIAEVPNGRGSFSGLQVLRVRDGLVLWQTTENLSGEASAPGLTSVVVQTYNVLRHKTTTWIIDDPGRPKRLETSGQLW